MIFRKKTVSQRPRDPWGIPKIVNFSENTCPTTHPMVFLEVSCKGESFLSIKKNRLFHDFSKKNSLPAPQGPLGDAQTTTNMVPGQQNRLNDATTTSRELRNQWYSTTTKYQVCTYPVPRAIQESRFTLDLSGTALDDRRRQTTTRRQTKSCDRPFSA